MIAENGHDLAAHLQVRHIGVQIQPVDAVHVQADMTVEHLVDVHHAGHTHSMRARGPALPARQPQPPPGRAGGGRGEVLPLPLMT